MTNWGQESLQALFLNGQEWPRLRVLDAAYFHTFFNIVAGRPSLVFPRLELLHTPSLSGAGARTLLALLNRGAFPSLQGLRGRILASNAASYTPVPTSPSLFLDTISEDDLAAQCDLLRRLPGTDAVKIGSAYSYNGGPPSFARFTTLLLDGGLAGLK